MKNKSTLKAITCVLLISVVASGCSVESKSKKKAPPVVIGGNGDSGDGDQAPVGKLNGLDGQWKSQCITSSLGNQVRTLDVAGKQMTVSTYSFQDVDCSVPVSGAAEFLDGTFEITADLEGGGVVVELTIPLDGNMSTSREFSLKKTGYGFSMSFFYNTAFDDPQPMVLEMRSLQVDSDPDEQTPVETATVLVDGEYERKEKVDQGCDHEITATYEGANLLSVSIVKASGCSPKFVSLECQDNKCSSSQGDYLEVLSETSYYFRAFYGFGARYELK